MIGLGNRSPRSFRVYKTSRHLHFYVLIRIKTFQEQAHLVFGLGYITTYTSTAYKIFQISRTDSAYMKPENPSMIEVLISSCFNIKQLVLASAPNSSTLFVSVCLTMIDRRKYF